MLGIGCAIGTASGAGLAVVFASYTLPSGSMWPTIAVGERLFANRTTKDPRRGAILVFRYPEHRESLFTKRVVGLPGDELAIVKGELTINGWKVPRCTVGKATFHDAAVPGDGARHEGTLSLEWLAGAMYLIFEEQRAPAASDAGPWTVKPGEYFVLGDNRDNSHDSRQWFAGAGGGVPFGDTIGRVRGYDTPTVPKGATELGPALAACLAKRPAQTDPPQR